jgi:hypothetical protein
MKSIKFLVLFILFTMMISLLVSCDNRTADTDKKEKEFENPFGYFSIVENNGDYSVSVEHPIDKQTFDQYFKSGSYWTHGNGYEVSVNSVDDDRMVGEGANRWSVMDNLKITIYGGAIMSPISIHTYDYSFDNGVLSIGEAKYVVCHIDNMSMGLIEEAYLQDGTPRWIYYKAHAISEDDFSKWYENASK